MHALTRNLEKAGTSHAQFEQRCNLWNAIKNASGFSGGFAHWWDMQQLEPRFPEGFPYLIPTSTDVRSMFESFRCILKKFEADLMQHRIQKAKTRRRKNLQHVFKDCQRDRPNLVDALIQSRTGIVSEIRVEDSSIIIDPPVRFKDQLPLVCEGKQIPVIHAEEDQIWVDDLANLEVGSIIRQEQSVVTDKGILHEFERVWSDRWQKLAHMDPNHWGQIVEFIRRHMSSVQWKFEPWTPQVVKQLIRGKKRLSAVGADGVSRNDLKQLPQAGVQALSDMFANIEEHHSWPSQLTVGFVSSLDKGKGSDSVDGFRPITIYPIIYRLWSTKRAREALAAVKDVLPACIKGGVPFQQAKSVWFEVSRLVEAAHWEGSSLQGLVLDIRRCFNALPRIPLWEMLRALNFPDDLIATWAAFAAAQTRRFKVRKSVGQPIASCVGLPEGCGLSVFGMVLYDWAFQLWLDASCNIPKQLFVYIDDWQIIYYDPSHLEELLSCVQTFTDLLDLEIDIKKSFSWSAHTSDRSELHSSDVPVVLAARDLGAHQNFSKKLGNCILTSRIKAIGPTWKQLARSLAPYKSKLFALVQLAWTRSLYAVSITSLGQKHFADLRTGASRGLKTARVGSNPCLHLSTSGCIHDPECWAIINTIREAREVGSYEQLRTMLCLRGSGHEIPQHGPTMVLIRRLCRLGWVLDSHGNFTDDIGSFNPLRLSWDALMLRIRRSWPATMAAMVSHRASFSGLAGADIDEVLRAIKLHGESDQVYLRCALDGTLYTDTHKLKADRGRQSLCQYCGELDGFQHCLWECPEFSTLRKDFPWFDVLHLFPSCFTCHGWMIQPPTWVALLQEFQAIPLPSVAAVPRDADLAVLDLFTDGTCLFPGEPKIRFAGWAVTWASSGTNSLDHEVLAAGHVSGVHQSSYRAELVAIGVAFKIAVDSGKPTRIWCDCDSIVKRCRRLQSGGRIKPNASHSDLWEEINLLICSATKGNVQVGKVMSHGSLSLARSELETWIFWHNQLVDTAAADFNVRRSTAFWTRWMQVVRELFFLRAIHADIFKLIIRIGRSKKVQSGAEQSQQDVAVGYDEDGGGSGGPSMIDASGHIPKQWIFTAPLVRHCLRANLDPILKWWTHVGLDGFGKFRLVWISGLQLYIDFCYTMDNPGPVMIRGKWLDPQIVGFRAHSLKLVRRIKSFITMWKSLLKANGLRVPAKLLRPHSSSIAYWCQCYRLPWNPKRMKVIDNIILGIHHKQVLKPEHLGSVSLFPIPKGNALQLHGVG